MQGRGIEFKHDNEFESDDEHIEIQLVISFISIQLCLHYFAEQINDSYPGLRSTISRTFFQFYLNDIELS